MVSAIEELHQRQRGVRLPRVSAAAPRRNDRHRRRRHLSLSRRPDRRGPRKRERDQNQEEEIGDLFGEFEWLKSHRFWCRFFDLPLLGLELFCPFLRLWWLMIDVQGNKNGIIIFIFIIITFWFVPFLLVCLFFFFYADFFLFFFSIIEKLSVFGNNYH